MSYRIHSKKDANVVESILEFDEKYEDKVTDRKKDFQIGDAVEITVDGKWKGVVGAVVYSAYGLYRVEPYNTPYWNNPANICKLGPFSDAELRKVAKKSGWSTVYKGGESPEAGVVRVSKVESSSKKVESNSEAEELRSMFSGKLKQVK